jgi:hypothetical protein
VTTGSNAHRGLFAKHFHGVGPIDRLALLSRIQHVNTARAVSNPWTDLTLSKPDIFSVFTRIKMHKGYAEDQRRGQASKRNLLEVYLPGEQGNPSFETAHPWRRK